MALTKVSTPAIKDEAITLAKLLHGDANSDGKFLRANNGADPTFETVTSTTINNNADNRVITGSGAANTLNAESDVVIDSSGRLLLGTTSILHTLDNKLNVAGTDASTAISLNRYSDNAFAAYLYFRKSRSGTIGGNTSVQDGDLLGRIYFEGNDGSSPVSAAYIEAYVDGTPGNQDMPGRLEFLTAADGSPTPVERMRIDSNGKLLLNTTAVTNTNDQLTVKRPASDFTEISLSLDATTATGSNANALMFTKSKGSYWNGYAFQSSHGYIGALLGKRESSGTTDQEIRLEIGGDSPNQNEEKTWTFQNDGDFSIDDGNLKFASGHGIDFSATSGTGTSELLDDYEEGTWTPSLQTTNNNYSGTQTTQEGIYIKVGRSVWVFGRILRGTVTGGSGTVQITGLPFGSNHGAQYESVVHFGYRTGVGYTSLTGYVSTTTDRLNLAYNDSNATYNVSVGALSSGWLYFSCHYYADS